VVFDDGLRSTLLQNGDVLITGMSAEADPYANRFTPGTESFLPAAPMNEGRKFHTLTLLPDGTVLAAGGSTSTATPTATTSTERYDPATDTWTESPAMQTARVYHTAIALGDGHVLVCGDDAERSCELFDPVANAWTSVEAFQAPEMLTMVGLQDGNVLALTGDNHRMPPFTELYDPSNDTWLTVAPPLNNLTFQARRLGTDYTMTLLNDGRVLFTGDRSATGGVPVLLWRK
jgi:hypothetical protein